MATRTRDAFLVGAQHANRPHVNRRLPSSWTIPSQQRHPDATPSMPAVEPRPFPLVLPARLGRQALVEPALSAKQPKRRAGQHLGQPRREISDFTVVVSLSRK